MDDRSHWLAWAAGIIDGEGCIRLVKSKRRTGFSWAVKVGVWNTDIRMLDRLRQLFGGCVTQRESGYKGNRRPAWEWVVTHKKAAEVLSDVMPWLTVKCEQAELAILSRRYLRPGRKLASRSRKEIAEQIEIVERLKAAKQLPTAADLPGRAILRVVGE